MERDQNDLKRGIGWNDEAIKKHNRSIESHTAELANVEAELVKNQKALELIEAQLKTGELTPDHRKKLKATLPGLKEYLEEEQNYLKGLEDTGRTNWAKQVRESSGSVMMLYDEYYKKLSETIKEIQETIGAINEL